MEGLQGASRGHSAPRATLTPGLTSGPTAPWCETGGSLGPGSGAHSSHGSPCGLQAPNPGPARDPLLCKRHRHGPPGARLPRVSGEASVSLSP